MEPLKLPIITQRLKIERFDADDLEALYSYMSLPEVVYPACLPLMKTLEDAKKLLNSWITDDTHYALRLRADGTLVGHIAVKGDSEESRADTRELGYALNPAYQHSGYMTESVRDVMAYLYNTGEIRYIWACCFEDNVPSRRLIERCGFVYQNTGILFSEQEQKEKPSYECRAEKKIKIYI